MTALKAVKTSPSFDKGFRSAAAELKASVIEALKDLLLDPIPKKRRFEKLKGFKNPAIYTIHATLNHSHKISFSIEDGIAQLRKLATHKEIDRTP